MIIANIIFIVMPTVVICLWVFRHSVFKSFYLWLGNSEEDIIRLKFGLTPRKVIINKSTKIKNRTHDIKVIVYRKGNIIKKYSTQILIGSPGALPNILLDSTDKVGSLYSEKHKEFKKFQRHSFEGDFDGYFTVYTPENMKIESMQFLTPDVIFFLKDNFPDFDILMESGVVDMRKFGKVEDDKLENKLEYLVTKIDRIYKYWSTQDKIDSIANKLK